MDTDQYNPNDHGPRVLVIDDDEVLTQYLELILEAAGYVVKIAHDGEDGLKLAEEFSPHLILVDFMMPVIDGLTFCKILSSNPRYSTTYLVILSAKSDGQIEGLDVGADDYLLKPINSELLLAHVRKGIRVAKRRNYEYTDPETRLWSRSFFQSLLEIEVYRAKRYRSELSLILMKFTSSGEADKLPSQFLNLIEGLNLRQADMICRWADDELAIALPHTSAIAGSIIVTRSTQLLGPENPLQLAGKTCVDLDYSLEIIAIAEGNLFGSLQQNGSLMVNGGEQI